MILEGDQSVFEAIREKKRLMEAHEQHDHIKIMAVVDGGLMKGAYGVGAALALEELGYTEVFDSIVGVSSGAPSAAYFVSGQIKESASLLYEECCSKEFFNIWRFWSQVNTKHFIEVLKGKSGKGINTQKLFAARTKLYIGVSQFETGEPELINPKNEQELFDSIQASILMPNIAREKVFVNAVRYVDGGFTRPHVLGKAISDIECTHILIITNQDKLFVHVPKLERFLNDTLFRMRMNKLLRHAARERRKERIKVLDALKNGDNKPHAVVWGDGSIASFERDPVVVKRVMEQSHKWWRSILTS